MEGSDAPRVMERKQWLSRRLSMENARYIFKMKVEEEVSGKTKITPSQEEF